MKKSKTRTGCNNILVALQDATHSSNELLSNDGNV